MANIIVYLIFSVLLASSIAISVVSFVCCKRWCKAYNKLKFKYETTYSENVRLQHKIYKLTYVTPSVDEKKREDVNGTK